MQPITEIYIQAKKIDHLYKHWLSLPSDAPLGSVFFEHVDYFVKTCLPKSHGLPEAFTDFLTKNQPKIERLWEQFQLSNKTMPTADFFQEFFSVIDFCTKTLKRLHCNPHTLTPVHILHEQGVNNEQIARIYGFIHPSGVGDVEVIAQELREKGTGVPADYLHPLEVKRRKNREVIDSWLAEDAEAIASADAVTLQVNPLGNIPEPQYESPIEQINAKAKFSTLMEAYEQGVSPGAAADELLLPVAQVVSFYQQQELSDTEEPVVEDVADEPEWAQGESDETLREIASSNGIMVRSNMKRSTIISRIEEAKVHNG